LKWGKKVDTRRGVELLNWAVSKFTVRFTTGKKYVHKVWWREEVFEGLQAPYLKVWSHGLREDVSLNLFFHDLFFRKDINDILFKYSLWVENYFPKGISRAKHDHETFGNHYTLFDNFPLKKKNFMRKSLNVENFSTKAPFIKKFLLNPNEPLRSEFFIAFSVFSKGGYYDWFSFNNLFRLNDWNYNVVFSDDFIDELCLPEDFFFDFVTIEDNNWDIFTEGLLGAGKIPLYFFYYFFFFYFDFDFYSFYVLPFFEVFIFLWDSISYFVSNQGYFITNGLRLSSEVFRLEAMLHDLDVPVIFDLFFTDFVYAFDEFFLIAGWDFMGIDFLLFLYTFLDVFFYNSFNFFNFSFFYFDVDFLLLFDSALFSFFFNLFIYLFNLYFFFAGGRLNLFYLFVFIFVFYYCKETFMFSNVLKLNFKFPKVYHYYYFFKNSLRNFLRR
jgi:hypothetical protein